MKLDILDKKYYKYNNCNKLLEVFQWYNQKVLLFDLDTKIDSKSGIALNVPSFLKDNIVWSIMYDENK